MAHVVLGKSLPKARDYFQSPFSRGGGLPHRVGHFRAVPLAGHGKRMSVHRGQARVSLDRIRRFHLKDAGFSTMKGLCLTE